MSTPVPAILGIFTVAGLTLIVSGCEPLENALKLANNGQPMPGGPSQVSYYVSPVPSVPVVEVALEDEIVPAECIVPPLKFRELWCNPATNNLEPIP